MGEANTITFVTPSKTVDVEVSAEIMGYLKERADKEGKSIGDVVIGILDKGVERRMAD